MDLASKCLAHSSAQVQQQQAQRRARYRFRQKVQEARRDDQSYQHIPELRWSLHVRVLHREACLQVVQMLQRNPQQVLPPQIFWRMNLCHLDEECKNRHQKRSRHLRQRHSRLRLKLYYSPQHARSNRFADFVFQGRTEMRLERQSLWRPPELFVSADQFDIPHFRRHPHLSKSPRKSECRLSLLLHRSLWAQIRARNISLHQRRHSVAEVVSYKRTRSSRHAAQRRHWISAKNDYRRAKAIRQ